MILTVEFKPETAAEAEEAYLWYESRSPGLGSDFVLALDACVTRVQRNPKAYEAVHKEIRRALLKRFPYGVYYLHDEPKLTIYAVFHGKRDPKVLADRLKI